MNSIKRTKIKLEAIERAITANCLIDHTTSKRLLLSREKMNKNKNVGRWVFIIVAQQAGYEREDICNFLEMDVDSFEHAQEKIGDMCEEGKEQFLQGKHTEDIALFFYRKLLLISNYLKSQFGFVVYLNR